MSMASRACKGVCRAQRDSRKVCADNRAGKLRRRNASSAAGVCGFLAAAAVVLSASIAHAGYMYTVTDLGRLPNSPYSGAMGINNSGQVVGVSGSAGFVWTSAGGMQNLGSLPGYNSCYATSINDSGQITGSSGSHAVLYTSTAGMQDLGSLSGLRSSCGLAINSSGQIVGECDTDVPVPLGTTVSHAFSYTVATGMQDLGTFGAADSQANDVNDNGQIVGFFGPDGFLYSHPFLYTPGTGMLDLGKLPGGTGAQARAINNSGQVVGTSFTSDHLCHAFLYTSAGGMRELGPAGEAGNNVAYALNDIGQIVGFHSASSGPNRASLWTNPDERLDLNDLIPPSSGWTLQRAFAINDLGQIVGDGKGPSGHIEAFLLTPNYGDANLDGNVNFIDFQAILDHWQSSGQSWASGDFSNDGLVNFADFQLLLDRWNPLGTAGTSVPEPATLALLLVGAVCLRKRRTA